MLLVAGQPLPVDVHVEAGWLEAIAVAVSVAVKVVVVVVVLDVLDDRSPVHVVADVVVLGQQLVAVWSATRRSDAKRSVGLLHAADAVVQHHRGYRSRVDCAVVVTLKKDKTLQTAYFLAVPPKTHFFRLLCG